MVIAATAVVADFDGGGGGGEGCRRVVQGKDPEFVAGGSPQQLLVVLLVDGCH